MARYLVQAPWIVCSKIARPALRNVVFDYDQHTSAEDLDPEPQSPRGSTSTPHDPHPMAPGEWNGNHNDPAFLMVGVPAYLSRSRTGLTRDGCAECLPAKGGVIVLLGRSNLQRRKNPLEQTST